MSSLEKIAARRAELDELAEALAEVDAEREELAVAERVLRRLNRKPRRLPPGRTPVHRSGCRSRAGRC